MQCPCCASEISEAVILSEAGRIAVRRRKTHAGPALTRPCRWCSAPWVGVKSLEAHERICAERPSGELDAFSDADLAAIAWTPPDAA